MLRVFSPGVIDWLRLLAVCPSLQAAIVPALAGLLITPLLMYKLFPPEIKDTPEAPKVRHPFVLLYRCCFFGSVPLP